MFHVQSDVESQGNGPLHLFLQGAFRFEGSFPSSARNIDFIFLKIDIAASFFDEVGAFFSSVVALSRAELFVVLGEHFPVRNDFYQWRKVLASTCIWTKGSISCGSCAKGSFAYDGVRGRAVRPRRGHVRVQHRFLGLFQQHGTGVIDWVP
jgi:hypothetical protein